MNNIKPDQKTKIKPKKLDKSTAYEVRPEQSVDLLKALHILTNDGKINQDSRRKLKQIYHLFNFIKPLLEDILSKKDTLSLVDHGAGKSYLGFIIYDVRINRVVYSLFDKSSFVVFRRVLSYSKICEV